MVTEQLKNYIQDNISLIDQEKYDLLFFRCDNKLKKELYTTLQSVGIHPLLYMKVLPKGVFENSDIVSIEIPNNIVFIDCDAFSHCKHLKNINLSNNVETIGIEAFLHCTDLTSIVLPDSVTELGFNAFCGCTSLTNVTIGRGVKLLGGDSFGDCDSLNAVHISDLTSWCNIKFGNMCSNPLYYAKKLYLNGQLVTNLVIPSGIDSVGRYAFINSTELTSVEITDSITTIGEYAFDGCTGLTSITIPDSVTSVGDGAFSWCSSLTSVTVGSNVTLIGRDAFKGCNLKEIRFNKTVDQVKHEGWNTKRTWCQRSGIKKIICIDGEIELWQKNLSKKK